MTTSSPVGAAGPSAEDQAAVAAVPQRIVAAWAAHDAEAFADTFTEDGTLILPGAFLAGRDKIRSFMAAGFAGPYKGTQVTGQPIHVRFLEPQICLVITEGGVLGPGQSKLPDASVVRASWLLAKTDGQWLLTAYQNGPRDAAA